jgi:tetratricopeptide (TPR) repeat protein
LQDERFPTWALSIKALKQKFFLGYGPENFSAAFDENFDPKLGIMWWDKPHNALLQIASDAGVIALLVYLIFFVAIFWKMQKKKSELDKNTKIFLTSLQATLIAYFIANLFSFDCFPTYLMFFFIVAHTLRSVRDTSGDQMLSKKIANLKNPIVIIIFIALAIFLWQYNLVPFYINSQINKADALVQNKNCSGAFEKMDGILELNSFIKLYSMTEYINFEKVCSELYPENILAYTKKAIELFKEVVKIRPTYTRYWINIGSLTRYLAEQEQDLKIKNELMNQTNYYLDKALQLAPKHQEIWLEKAKTEISAGNYKTAKENSEKCIELNSKTSDCYWYLGLSQIYLKENDEANKNIESAKVKGYNVDAPTSLIELGNAYGSENVLDYYNLSIVFDKLLSKNPDNAQYHATLAFVYAKLGQYTKAREEAMIVLKLSPDSKENIEVFLKTLPY